MLKKFEEYSNKSPLVLLIDDDGSEHLKPGDYEEGHGIFDDQGKEYPAGVLRDGTVVVAKADGNSALKLSNDTEKIEGLKNCLEDGFNYFEGNVE